MNVDVRQEAAAVYQEYIDLIETLCAIPAPLHGEGARARFVLDWLEKNGLNGGRIDKSGNVIFPYNCIGEKYIAFTAHMDTVFLETDPFAVTHEGSVAKCPGIGDDTANMAAMLLLARWAIHKQVQFDHPLLFVWDTGEEGLGDLRGVRGLMEDYAGHIAALVALDAVYPNMVNSAVGSVRYRITIETAGGHSYRNFGSPNAIERMAALIETFYQQLLPEIEGCTTTFNVGVVSGGTSVNTIAQSAELLYEFRSDRLEGLERMDAQMRRILQEAEKTCSRLTFEEIGRRPAGGAPASGQAALEQHWIDAVAAILPDRKVKAMAGSTDCNIPLSQGIPAICIGGYRGGAAHTHEEWIDYDSLETGYALLLRFLTSFAQ